MADHYNNPLAVDGRQQGKACAANLRGIVAGLEAVAARCGRGMATADDADFLSEQVAEQPWMTFQGADLLRLHAQRMPTTAATKPTSCSWSNSPTWREW